MTSPTVTILIVDDEARNRRLLEALLRPEGYLTLTAASGEEALAAIAQHAPDLILLDIMMPGLDGYQVARILKTDPATSHIPIIMLTARIDRSACVAALNSGAEEFLTKPVDRAELWLRVRNLLRLKTLGDRLQKYSASLEQEVQARTAELQRFRTAMDTTVDAIFMVNRTTMRYVEVNATACSMFGYTREELFAMGPTQLGMAPLERVARVFDAVIAGRGTTELTEIEMQRKDGSKLQVDVRWHAHRSGADWIIVGVMRDITARKETEAALRESEIRIKYLNRVYAVLSGINALIVRAGDREELFREACRIAVEDGGFRMSWIGIVDRSAMKLVPVAFAGADNEMTAAIKERFAPSLNDSAALKNSMAARAITEKKACVSNDTQNDPKVVFSKQFMGSGVLSMLMLPLIVAGEVVGVFALYASEIEFFHAEEMKLLTELASHIAFAVNHISNEEKIARLNRVYAVLSGINALIVRARDREELFNATCQISVTAGAFRMSMICVVDRSAMRIVPVATGGKNERLLAAVDHLVSSSEIASTTRVAQAIRAKVSIVANDLQSDPKTSLREHYGEAGIGSMAVLPLIRADEAIGALVLYAGERGFFDAEEMRLLTELAGNIAFALDHIENGQKLIVSELRFRQMSENIRDVFLLIEVDSGRVLYISPVYREIWGRSCESLYADPASWTEAIHPEDRASADEKYEQGMAAGAFDCEYRIMRPDGSIRAIKARGFPVRDDAGNIVRIAIVAEDITERKQTEAALRESDRRFSDMLGNVELVSLMVDSEARITYCNEYLLRLTGWRHEELIGQNCFELLIPPELTDLKDVIFPALLDNQPDTRHHENEILTRAGERRLIRWNNSVLRSAAGDVIGTASIGEDITGRKRDQDALQKLNTELEDRVRARTSELNLARDEAEQASRAKSTFLATMSHEIRTPMNGVIGMIDVLQQTSLKGDQVEMVELIRDSAFSLLDIVEDILDLSKIEAGKANIANEPVQLTDVVEKVCAMLAPMAAKRGTGITVFVDPAIPFTVAGDAGRLRQVLVNLTGNAIKFSSGGDQPGKISVRAELVERSGQAATVDLIVTDNGIGMDEATLGVLFKPFSQADASTTRRFGGTGLGLAISSFLVGLMDGEISVRSVPGEGSTFTVRFRFTVLEEPVTGEATVRASHHGRQWEPVPAPPRDEAPLQRRSILVAEDNETNRKVILHQLQLIGFAPDIVANGRDALKAWRRGDYALLLTDLHMPEMDGYALVAAIRAEEGEGRRIPIIALSANALRDGALRCRAAGMDAYLTKPVRLAQLKAAIEAWLGPMAKAKALRDTGLMPGTAAPAADLDTLVALVGDDPAAIEEILQSFRKSAGKSSGELSLGVRAGSVQAVAAAAHKLKSAARSIGAMRLGEICDEFEQAAEAGKVQELNGLLPPFEMEMDKVNRFIDSR